MKYFSVLFLALFLFTGSTGKASHTFFADATCMMDGGGQEKEKKTKHVKALKRARRSAKEAKYASQESRRQVMLLAKVRNFFHNTFNSKPGNYRNFRSRRTQQAWLKSKS